MWFKQNDPKSPQEAEPVPARPQAQPAAPQPAPSASPAAPPMVAHAAPAPPVAAPVSPQASRITPGLSLKGDISGTEELWIGGSIEGTLHFSGARVTVGNSGNVRGEIDAREIVIEGRVDGNLRAGDRLALIRSAQVKGDASAPRVAVEDGAVFNGSMHVIREGESRPASRGASTASHSPAPARPLRAGTSQAASAAAASTGVSAGIAASAPDRAEGETSSDTRVGPRPLLASPDSE
jgi:cytoskeletal protein CcmA (bactofilin family)